MTLGYVRALDHGLRAVRRGGGPQHLTLDLIRQLHRVLISAADYRHLEGPGEWRRTQNWIGGRRSRGRDADPAARFTFGGVPDRPGGLSAVDNTNITATMALPLRMTVAHVQFEAIHRLATATAVSVGYCRH